MQNGLPRIYSDAEAERRKLEKIKIVVFGIGKRFWENKEYIEKKYSVLAWSDNFITESDNLPWKYVFPTEIVNLSCNMVLVTSDIYFESIRYQLINCGISYDDIVLLNINQNDCLYRQCLNDLETYKQLAGNPQDIRIMLADRADSAGSIPAHYFMQDLYVARKVYANNPKEHYDIGSRLDGFLAHLLVFREVKFIDIRPLDESIDGLIFTQADATSLIGIDDGVIESLSCLHALEHFGLGRYGDPIEPDGFVKVANSIQRVMRRGGIVYLSVPISNDYKVIFNAHRIFHPIKVIELFPDMKLLEFSVINPTGCKIRRVEISDMSNTEYQEYSCGIFIFVKK